LAYDPRPYWENRGATYLWESHEGDDERREWIRKIVEQLKPESVLEVGAGPGKNFPAFKGVPEPHATDFSESAIASIPDRMGVLVEWMDSKDLKFPDRSMDLVVSCAHLVHIPRIENQIDRAIREVCRVTKKHLLIMEFWDPQNLLPVLDPHCFKHNYPELITPHGFITVIQRQLSARIGLFLFRRREL